MTLRLKNNRRRCGDSDIELDASTQFISNEAPNGNDIHCSAIISGRYRLHNYLIF